MDKALSYQDIYLIPEYTELFSRSQADTSVFFLGRKFSLPIIPANMESVVDEKICEHLAFNNLPYAYHRFSDTFSFVERSNHEAWPLISISLGVGNNDRELLEKIKSNNLSVDWIFLDIAHGHSLVMKNMIFFVKSIMPDVKIIAGNVATKKAVEDLADWGADAVKVGIAGGQACSTKHETGFHVPMFTCVGNCSSSDRFIQIIADGGIRDNGDIAKALVAGADMVMAGGLFAACIDAPGESVYVKHGIKNIVTHKRYHGSASAKQKKKDSHVEGLELDIPCNGKTYADKYIQLHQALASSISYAGKKDLTKFSTVEYLTVK